MLSDCGARFLKLPWTARSSNQPILKEINPECSPGLMLNSQYFGHQIQRADSLEKTLMLGQIEGRRRRERQRLRRLDSITDSMDMNLSKLWEIVDRGDWCAATHRVARAGYDLATKQNVQLHTFFFSVLVMTLGMQDLSSPTRD